MPFEKNNKYGELSRRSKDLFKQDIKDKLKNNVEQVLQHMDVTELTNNQKLKYLQVVLPYLAPKLRLSYNNDVRQDVPLFCDEPKILVFTSAEQKQQYDNASEEEKLEMEKDLDIKFDK
tara:strand:+ start:187 stop:543 length:357 start_codon:yes stop_codon:yes gene_type:complete